MPGFEALSVALALTTIPLIYKKKRSNSNINEKNNKEEQN